MPIDCPKYAPETDSERCRLYGNNGACRDPFTLTCTEWAKVNLRQRRRPDRQDARGAMPVRSAPGPGGKGALPPALGEAEVASFRASGPAIKLSDPEIGDLWIVPEYSHAAEGRKEIRIDHVAKVAEMLGAFEGSRLTALISDPKT